MNFLNESVCLYDNINTNLQYDRFSLNNVGASCSLKCFLKAFYKYIDMYHSLKVVTFVVYSNIIQMVVFKAKLQRVYMQHS